MNTPISTSVTFKVRLVPPSLYEVLYPDGKARINGREEDLEGTLADLGFATGKRFEELQSTVKIKGEAEITVLFGKFGCAV